MLHTAIVIVNLVTVVLAIYSLPRWFRWFKMKGPQKWDPENRPW